MTGDSNATAKTGGNLVAVEVVESYKRAEFDLFLPIVQTESHSVPVTKLLASRWSIFLDVESLRLLIQEEAVPMRGAAGWGCWPDIISNKRIAGCKLAVWAGLQPGLNPVQDGA